MRVKANSGKFRNVSFFFSEQNDTRTPLLEKATRCLSVVLCPSQTATGLTDQQHWLPLFLTGQTGATPVPAQSLYPFSHPTVLTHFQYLVRNHPHNPRHADSGGFSFHAVTEPVQLPGSQWLGILHSTLVSNSVGVLQLQYIFATGHFRLGALCIVPGTSCPSKPLVMMQAQVSTLL